jgi:hypothetical protein
MKTTIQLLTYPVGTRNSTFSTSSDSDRFHPPTSDPAGTLFGNNYLVIFLGSFRMAGTFLPPYYKSSWMGPLSVTLVVN